VEKSIYMAREEGIIKIRNVEKVEELFINESS